MITILDVVNSCLATLGEAPLNTLLEPHEFRGTAQKSLDRASRRIQSRGWWYNTEVATFSPSPVNANVQLPTDCLKWQSGTRKTDTLVRGTPQPWIVQRGTRLYDTRTRSFELTEDVAGELVREVPFEDLPSVMADYIAAEAVLRFQSDYDADNSKRQELTQDWQLARIEANSENIRQANVNLLGNSVRLSRIKSVTRRARYN